MIDWNSSGRLFHSLWPLKVNARWPDLFWWSRQHYAPLTFSEFAFCLLRLLLLSAERNGSLKSTWALFYQSKPFVWSRNRFALWRNLREKAARAFISQSQEPITCQSQFILLTIRVRVQACHIGRVRGLSFRAYPVSVSVETEAPGELPSS